MPDNPSHPLTEEHLQRINDALDKLKAADDAITKAQTAGIDTGTRRQEVSDARAKLTQIKSVYFPGR